MNRHKHPDSTLIDAVGIKTVSSTFGLSPQALYMWRQRGIPLAKRISFAKLCAENGISTPQDFFQKFEIGDAA